MAAGDERIKGLILLATPGYNMEEVCQRIKCPTLILHGYLDELVPRHQAHLLKKYISNSELIEIEGADHAFTNPEKLNEVFNYISDWFKKYW
ncbi:MAG: hypothetical protein CO145_02890 [Candidatus Nealsonbacteria bacterium CG_4_9_14_3_um_filter_37_13]|uniref:Dienelactone hydrolase domain-containing protein n=1 Tax=Candidatus Nealsonbacteria bacterium CG_4_9_14_3_um_filter_37_13 TaxID=1974695 RepID=A0A2M7Z4C4_9BACT|nr:MAG: hypothetical protein CO145_02890 [Candidatus Nealsonbacteria bacterium CG_4_9_14_3_um_filter_37_13]